MDANLMYGLRIGAQVNLRNGSKAIITGAYYRGAMVQSNFIKWIGNTVDLKFGGTWDKEGFYFDKENPSDMDIVGVGISEDGGNPRMLKVMIV